MPTGICPGCGKSGPLPILYGDTLHRLFVCGSLCWQGNFADKLGPLDDDRRLISDRRIDRDRRTGSTHTKSETVFSAYGPKADDAQSTRVDYSAKARTSYPIPAGYRMMSEMEAIDVGDMVWDNKKHAFEYADALQIGAHAGAYICAITSTAGTVFDISDDRAGGLFEQACFPIGTDGIGFKLPDKGKITGATVTEGDRTARVQVVTPEFYAAAQKVVRAWIDAGPNKEYHEAAKLNLRNKWRTLANAVDTLADVSGLQ